MSLDLGIDEVLSTTRSVRRRLDLTRPVDLETIRECLDLAVQAPTGGSIERWRWVIVQDPEVRSRVAQLYREVADEPFRVSELGAPSSESRRAYAGARLLAQVLDQVPLLVFACMEGEPRDWTPLGVSAFYGSILPAVWSFQLALRARGLGSTLTVAHLLAASSVAEVLGIPEGITQVAMLPVAYTVGTDFQPARRRDVAEVTYLDVWGRKVPGWDLESN